MQDSLFRTAWDILLNETFKKYDLEDSSYLYLFLVPYWSLKSDSALGLGEVP